MQTHFKNFQREMRKNMPLPEVVLWKEIRNKNLGVKFRRQYTINNRILDFYSPEIKLGIEIDGETHFTDEEIQKKDLVSDKELLERGIKILRFLNPEVMKNLEGVLERILEEIKSPTSFLPLGKGEDEGGGAINQPL